MHASIACLLLYGSLCVSFTWKCGKAKHTAGTVTIGMHHFSSLTGGCMQVCTPKLPPFVQLVRKHCDSNGSCQGHRPRDGTGSDYSRVIVASCQWAGLRRLGWQNEASAHDTSAVHAYGAERHDLAVGAHPTQRDAVASQSPTGGGINAKACHSYW